MQSDDTRETLDDGYDNMQRGLYENEGEMYKTRLRKHCIIKRKQLSHKFSGMMDERPAGNRKSGYKPQIRVDPSGTNSSDNVSYLFCDRKEKV